MVKRSRQDKDNEKIPLRPHHNGTEGVKKKQIASWGYNNLRPMPLEYNPRDAESDKR